MGQGDPGSQHQTAVTQFVGCAKGADHSAGVLQTVAAPVRTQSVYFGQR
jgi:hypothetical protein